MTHTVTAKRAALVLELVAQYLGTKGFGTPICPEGRTLTGSCSMQHDDGTWCDDCTFGPAPTGKEAAYSGTGPMLVDDFDGAPAIVLEGGPDEWAYGATWAVQDALDAKGVPVRVEPYYSFVLSIYPN